VASDVPLGRLCKNQPRLADYQAIDTTAADLRLCVGRQRPPTAAAVPPAQYSTRPLLVLLRTRSSQVRPVNLGVGVLVASERASRPVPAPPDLTRRRRAIYVTAGKRDHWGNPAACLRLVTIGSGDAVVLWHDLLGAQDFAG
jgi:hypothetical protein